MRGKSGSSTPNRAVMSRSEHITLLLASYQGEAYLKQQLNSLAAQSHSDWSLIVGDDGSRDDTKAIVKEFAASQPAGRVAMIKGPCMGATLNFLNLLEAAPYGTAIAFCDQDDVWLPQKLEYALEFLRKADGPAHYAARTLICDKDLIPLTNSRRFARPLGFRNALVQACMAGNTSVFNPAAAELLKAAVPAARAARILSHDWWAYQITSAIGATLYHDPRPVLYYRQHGTSEVGRNDTFRAMAARMAKLFAGDFGTWLARNHQALHDAHLPLDTENRAILDRFGELLTLPGPKAAKQLGRMGLYRQTRMGSAALIGAALVGRLRADSAKKPRKTLL